MAFLKKNLAPAGGQSTRALAPQVFTYRTADTLATVRAAGYFNDVRSLLEIGDVILVSVVDDVDAVTDVTAQATFVVKDKSTTAVDVSDALSGGGFGTDSGAKVYVPFFINATDLAAGTAANVLSPVAGSITMAKAIVQEAVGTGGAITFAVGTTAVDGLTLTVADSATVGTIYSDTPTADHASTVVAVGSRLQVVPAAAFATSGAVNGYIEITLSEVDTD